MDTVEIMDMNLGQLYSLKQELEDLLVRERAYVPERDDEVEENEKTIASHQSRLNLVDQQILDKEIESQGENHQRLIYPTR
jgi:hypothetical protein